MQPSERSKYTTLPFTSQGKAMTADSVLTFALHIQDHSWGRKDANAPSKLPLSKKGRSASDHYFHARRWAHSVARSPHLHHGFLVASEQYGSVFKTDHLVSELLENEWQKLTNFQVQGFHEVSSPWLVDIAHYMITEILGFIKLYKSLWI